MGTMSAAGCPPSKNSLYTYGFIKHLAVLQFVWDVTLLKGSPTPEYKFSNLTDKQSSTFMLNHQIPGPCFPQNSDSTGMWWDPGIFFFCFCC